MEKEPRKVTKTELDGILKNHALWLETKDTLVEPKGQRADLSGADLSDVNLYGADLTGANLSEAHLSGADLSYAKISKTNLSGADLSYTNMTGTDLSGADMTGSNMRLADVLNTNMAGAHLNGANLSGAIMDGANLSGASIKSANMAGTGLVMANLTGADLSGADMQGANLCQARLGDACLTGVNLSETNMRHADMVGADLSGADLSGADLENARKYGVILAPTADLARTVDATASVEAEYGNICIEGKTATLAHHGPRSTNPAPCNADVEQLPPGSRILISHIDLDTVGGVMALEGRKPADPEFWKAAEFIDVKGIHHIHELPQEVQDKLNAYYAAEFAMRKEEGFPPRDNIKDVTENVEKRMGAVDIILDEKHKDHDAYIHAGIRWERQSAKAVEAQHVFDTENVRVFITDGPFCAASYYSPVDEEIKKATVTLNTRMNAVTVAFEDGGNPERSAKKIVQELWGPEAGGRDGIAGSPRGMAMGTKDLLEAAIKAEEAISPVVTIGRVEELKEMRGMLAGAIADNVKNRGLGIKDTLGDKEHIDMNARN